MTQPKAKPRTKLTNVDYMAMTPPANTGARYQLINGELVAMSGATLAHQVFLLELAAVLLAQVNTLGIGRIVIAPYDVHIDRFNTYQPDLLFVPTERLHLLERLGMTGAPNMVMEILSDSTRRRDLSEKLPVYAANGVREVWIVDLEAATVAIHAGDAMTPVAVFAAEDTLTSEAMPGVAIELAPIFARAVGA